MGGAGRLGLHSKVFRRAPDASPEISCRLAMTLKGYKKNLTAPMTQASNSLLRPVQDTATLEVQALNFVGM